MDFLTEYAEIMGKDAPDEIEGIPTRASAGDDGLRQRALMSYLKWTVIAHEHWRMMVKGPEIEEYKEVAELYDEMVAAKSLYTHQRNLWAVSAGVDLAAVGVRPERPKNAPSRPRPPKAQASLGISLDMFG